MRCRKPMSHGSPTQHAVYSVSISLTGKGVSAPEITFDVLMESTRSGTDRRNVAVLRAAERALAFALWDSTCEPHALALGFAQN